MAYEIEITIGNRTYHYGSAIAFSADQRDREERMLSLAVNFNRDSIKPGRKAELKRMWQDEQALYKALDKGCQDQMRDYYNILAQT